LTVAFPESDGEGDKEIASREFLTAMEVATGSKLASNNVENLGLDKLPGVFLVSIERPTHEQHPLVVASESYEGLSPAGSIEKEVLTQDPRMAPVSPDDPLAEGDILWFSGEAAAIGDLRKIPGLKSYVNEEVKKINEKVHDRRLVQAVIARRSKLVGKTVREAQFRTIYGAAVISVHREGQLFIT
jgi:Trk K+ transport system NAD-binding subunit